MLTSWATQLALVWPETVFTVAVMIAVPAFLQFTSWGLLAAAMVVIVGSDDDQTANEVTSLTVPSL